MYLLELEPISAARLSMNSATSGGRLTVNVFEWRFRELRYTRQWNEYLRNSFDVRAFMRPPSNRKQPTRRKRKTSAPAPDTPTFPIPPRGWTSQAIFEHRGRTSFRIWFSCCNPLPLAGLGLG